MLAATTYVVDGLCDAPTAGVAHSASTLLGNPGSERRVGTTAKTNVSGLTGARGLRIGRSGSD